MSEEEIIQAVERAVKRELHGESFIRVPHKVAAVLLTLIAGIIGWAGNGYYTNVTLRSVMSENRHQLEKRIDAIEGNIAMKVPDRWTGSMQRVFADRLQRDNTTIGLKVPDVRTIIQDVPIN